MDYDKSLNRIPPKAAVSTGIRDWFGKMIHVGDVLISVQQFGEILHDRGAMVVTSDQDSAGRYILDDASTVRPLTDMESSIHGYVVYDSVENLLPRMLWFVFFEKNKLDTGRISDDLHHLLIKISNLASASPFVYDRDNVTIERATPDTLIAALAEYEEFIINRKLQEDFQQFRTVKKLKGRS